jgi:hypothetical protein
MSEAAFTAGDGRLSTAYIVPARSLRGVTIALSIGLSVEAFFAVLSIAAYALRLHVISVIETGGSLARSTITLSDDAVQWVSWLSIPLLIIVLVILMVWVHQARRNLDELRAGPFRYSSAMAVGSFFIPFANFWLPCLVMGEIWRGSDPALPPEYPMPFAKQRTAQLVVLWWIVYLANTVFSWLVGQAIVAGHDSVTLSSLRQHAELQIAGRVLRLGSVALTAILAYRVMRREDALQRQVRPPAPQPPPLAQKVTSITPQ